MNHPLTLALDTIDGEMHACIVAGSGVHRATTDGSGKTRSTAILPLIESLLQQADVEWHDLELLAFSAGPGSFTGLRIAAATLAGINSGLHLPILHLDSLAVTARQAGLDTPIWVLEDARAGEAFVGRYEAGRVLSAPVCMLWRDIEAEIAPDRYVALGDADVAPVGWQRIPLDIERGEALAATVIAALAGPWRDAPRYPEPHYLQLSQAERNANV